MMARTSEPTKELIKKKTFGLQMLSNVQWQDKHETMFPTIGFLAC